MNATAVEKITPLKTEPSNRERRVLPPSLGFLVKWGLFALVGIGVVLSVVLGLVQKWLWMRQLDYQGIFWTLLSVKWGIFAVTLILVSAKVSLSHAAISAPQLLDCEALLASL